MNNITENNLEDLALKRKEKLNQLKRKRDEGSQNNSEEKNRDTVLPKPKFRSYKPQDDRLNEHIVPEATPGNVESEIKDQLESAKSGIVIDQLDISTLAPRKVDWDLKRDITRKLEKLERRTQKAMAEIIRERLKGQEHLAISMNAEETK